MFFFQKVSGNVGVESLFVKEGSDIWTVEVV